MQHPLGWVETAEKHTAMIDHFWNGLFGNICGATRNFRSEFACRVTISGNFGEIHDTTRRFKPIIACRVMNGDSGELLAALGL